MLDDSMLDGVSELIQPSFTIVQILADVGIELVGSAGNNHVIFRPSDSEVVDRCTWMGIFQVFSPHR